MKISESSAGVEDFSLAVNEYFARLDFDGLASYMKLLESKDPTGRLVANLITCVELYSKVLLEDVFTDMKTDQRVYFNNLMEMIPKLLCRVDIKASKLLLIPVKLLMDTEFDDVDQSRSELEELYQRSNILRIWPTMSPRIWSAVANAYRIVDEVVFAIHQELKVVSTTPTPLRNNVNRFLMEMRNNPKSSLGDFSLITVGLPDIWDLVDIELFLSVFPDEIRLTPTSKRMYKPSFARKIAMASILRFVNEHQQPRRPSGGKSSIAQLRDQVVECCKAANLDLAATSKYNNDARYYYTHLKRMWLVSAMRNSSLRTDEIYDHIQAEDSLVESMFHNLIDDTNVPPPTLAELATSHERLRVTLLQKRQFIDDPVLRMLISVCQGGRREKWIDVFGPKKSGAFVLPMDLGRPSTIPSTSSSVTLIDQIDDLSIVEDHLSSLESRSVVAVDVFFKVWRDVVLEKPIPNVLSIATESCIFLIMTSRVLSSSNCVAKRLRFRKFLERIFCDPKLLKLTPFWQFGGKFNSLISLWAGDDVFELDNTVCQTGTTLSPPTIVGPCMDFSRKILSPPIGSFQDACAQYLGITVCDFEENSNWNNLFLRNTQLHYIASRTWLTLQLFFADPNSSPSAIRPHIMWVDLNRLSSPGMYAQWRGSDGEIEAWTRENVSRNARFVSLISSTQASLWENIQRDLRNDSALTCDTSNEDDNEHDRFDVLDASE